VRVAEESHNLVCTSPTNKQTNKGVCHTLFLAFAIYIKKKYLKTKRRIMKTQIFHHAKIL
jgi:hypothetical protein